MLVEITAERVRYLECEACGWAVDVYEKGDSEEVDAAYVAENDHEFDCDHGRSAVKEWVEGVVSVWHTDAYDELLQVGSQVRVTVQKAGPMDKHFWRSLMP